MLNQILLGDCKDVLGGYPDDFFDSCVTDPPYGLSKEPDITEVLTKWLSGEDYKHQGTGFMGKSWDSFVPGPSIWREVYRVLKPGAYILCFAGTRTQDLMTMSLRLAGFEIRDVIEWLYFNGFPKSMDVSKAFDKRAGAEREVIGSRKPEGGSNFASWRESEGRSDLPPSHKRSEILITAPATDLAKQWDGWGTSLKPAHEPIIVARKPFKGSIIDNLEQYGTGALNINECRIGDEEVINKPPSYRGKTGEFVLSNTPYTTGKIEVNTGRFPPNIATVDPDAFYSKYCNVTPIELSKKASQRDRGECNNHPTVKPSDLISWLIKLVTQPEGAVLDPFAGSGSTLVAAHREGFNFVGIELEESYVEIARKRVGEAQQVLL